MWKPRGSNVDVKLLPHPSWVFNQLFEGTGREAGAKCSIFYISNFQFSKLISKLKYNLNLPENREQLQITGSPHSGWRNLKETLHSESDTMAIRLHGDSPILNSSDN